MAWVQGVGKLESSLQFTIFSIGTLETKGIHAEGYGLLPMLLSWPTKLELNLNLQWLFGLFQLICSLEMLQCAFSTLSLSYLLPLTWIYVLSMSFWLHSLSSYLTHLPFILFLFHILFLLTVFCTFYTEVYFAFSCRSETVEFILKIVILCLLCARHFFKC